MKSDLHSLMNDRNFDALLVTGPAQHNPDMFYMTGGGHLGQADLIIPRDQAPVLFHNPMERDEAAKTGLHTKSYSAYNFNDLLQESGGNIPKATALRYQKMFADAGVISGRVAVSGRVEAGYAIGMIALLKELMPQIEFVGEVNDSIFVSAMATKEPAEIERIRNMGRITTEVVGNTAGFLTSHRVNQEEILCKANGEPLTIGDVKRQINLWLAERGVENPEGTIFAIGRDAGVPHSTGNPLDFLRLGQTIVYDIFPCEAGGGYFYDFTRTWCLGYAPDEAQQLYEQVLAVYHAAMQAFQLNHHCPEYQKLACDLFEAQGHPTIQTNPATTEGYVHSLGHGLGLHVHERPSFGKNAPASDVITPGIVFTVEPGLYYPEKGLGVRLEDSVWVKPDGQIEVLAEYPMDLVLQMKK